VILVSRLSSTRVLPYYYFYHLWLNGSEFECLERKIQGQDGPQGIAGPFVARLNRKPSAYPWRAWAQAGQGQTDRRWS
jgi:hypothetical protein